MLFRSLVPLADLGVEIPAVIVETGRIGDRPHVRDRAALDRPESDDDVRDLDSRVVDVVLHFDRCAAEPEDADQCVPERRIAQVTDVRGLVRIDGRMFHDGLAVAHGETRRIGTSTLRYRDAVLSDHTWINLQNRTGVTAARAYYKYYVGDAQGSNIDYAPADVYGLSGTYNLTWFNAATKRRLKCSTGWLPPSGRIVMVRSRAWTV